MRDIDKYRGCLIGGAVGDALGYAIEFLQDFQIFEKYGECGITEYSLVNGIAPISDDTQMTLFTANGLLLGTTQKMMPGDINSYLYYIASCYKDWLKTQTAEEFGFESPEFAWLNNVSELNHRRAPGRTCISYLEKNNLGSTTDPRNNSKGCGGVMRVAPIGLYFEDSHYTIEQIANLGAEAAALTHGHKLGYIPAAMLVYIIHFLVHNTETSILEAVVNAKEVISHIFSNEEHLHRMIKITDKAIELSTNNNIDDLDAIRDLGQGWVAEETLAIAIYCSLKYENDFEKAIIASVNHSGDSDSTGSVTGNIMGVHLGMKAIPEKFLTNLELRDVILDIADDLFNPYKISNNGICHNEVWKRKYIYHTYPNK